MNRFSKFINKLIVNYAYGVKTDLVPEVRLPLDVKTITFARNNKNKIKQILDFQAEDFYGNKLPISLDTLNQRANRIFEAVQNINNNFLDLVTSENIDNPNFNTSVITEQIASTFDNIDSSILASEEVLKYRENKEILNFLRDNDLIINDYTSKGISIINNNASIDEFKKFASLKGMSEALTTIPDEKFIEGEYEKFVGLYGKHIPEMKKIGNFLDILIKLNIEKDVKYKPALRFVNQVIEKTDLELIRAPYSSDAKNKISHYFDCGAQFKMNHFLSLDNSIAKINPFTQQEMVEKEVKSVLYQSVMSLNSLSENYKSKLSLEFREKLEIFCALGDTGADVDVETRINDVLELMDSGFNISAGEIQIEMLKVKDALRKTYTDNLTSLKSEDLSRSINEYGVEEITFKGEEFNFLHHVVKGYYFENSHNTTLSSDGKAEIIHETWSKNPTKMLDPKSFNIDEQCYNTVSTDLITSNNIKAHGIDYVGTGAVGDVHLIYTDIPEENIVGSNRQGNGRERMNPIYHGNLGLQPFNDLKNQEETKTFINPWMGDGEIVVARNKIVKNEDGTEKVDNGVPFLKPSAVLIYGSKNRKPTEREIRIAQSLEIPLVIIDSEAYPLNIQEKAEQELTHVSERPDYEKVTRYLRKGEEAQRQTFKNNTDISVYKHTEDDTAQR